MPVRGAMSRGSLSRTCVGTGDGSWTKSGVAVRMRPRESHLPPQGEQNGPAGLGNEAQWLVIARVGEVRDRERDARAPGHARELRRRGPIRGAGQGQVAL